MVRMSAHEPMKQIIKNFPQLSRADLAVLAAIVELGPTAFRENLARWASIGTTRVSECCTRLEAAGLIVSSHHFNRKTQKTTPYRALTEHSRHLATMPVDKNVDNQPNSSKSENNRNSQMTIMGGVESSNDDYGNGVSGPERAESSNDHTMVIHDDDVSNKEEKEIKKLLSFLDAGGLRKLLKLKHLTVDYARQALAYYKHFEMAGWDTIGVKIWGGHMYRLIESGEEIAIQQQLPEDSWYTVDEFNELIRH